MSRSISENTTIFPFLFLFLAILVTEGFGFEAAANISSRRNGYRRSVPFVVDSTKNFSLRANLSSNEDWLEMTEFFQSMDDYTPLFRTVLSSPASSLEAPARSILSSGFFGDSESTSWISSPNAIPTKDSELGHISNFLDYLQKSLQEMPVDESNVEIDEKDSDFIERGRRLMVLTRFLVAEDASDRNAFKACWTEIAELANSGISDTGSLLLFPGYSGESMLRFSSEKLNRVLLWLGVNDIEVWPYCSKETNSPICGIMLIHKISDIPMPTSETGKVYKASDIVPSNEEN